MYEACRAGNERIKCGSTFLERRWRLMEAKQNERNKLKEKQQ